MNQQKRVEALEAAELERIEATRRLLVSALVDIILHLRKHTPQDCYVPFRSDAGLPSDATIFTLIYQAIQSGDVPPDMADKFRSAELAVMEEKRRNPSMFQKYYEMRV